MYFGCINFFRICLRTFDDNDECGKDAGAKRVGGVVAQSTAAIGQEDQSNAY